MKKPLTLLSLGALMALSSHGAVQTHAAPNVFVPRGKMKKTPVIIAPNNLPQVGGLALGAPIPLMTEMFDYARIGNVAKGSKAAVYATVVITSPSFYSTPGRSSVAYANSALTLDGSKGSEYFTGDLQMIRNNGVVNAPFQGIRFGNASTRITIRRDGFVSIRTTITGRLKSNTETTSFKSDGADGFLWGRDANDGKPQLVSVMLSKSVFPLNGASSPIAEAPPAPSGPRGMRVRVSPSFKIMNSDDGVGFFKKDMTIELSGSLYLGSKKAWSRGGSNELSATKGNTILGESIEVEIFYDNPASWRLRVIGSLEDSDKPSVDNDIVWEGDENVDLKAAIEQGGGQIVLKVQDDDEYADLRLKVEKLSDIN